jgi:hypothetical protein
MSEIMRKVHDIAAFVLPAPPGAVATYEAEDDKSSTDEFEAHHEPRFDSGAQLDVGIQRTFTRKVDSRGYQACASGEGCYPEQGLHQGRGELAGPWSATETCVPAGCLQWHRVVIQMARPYTSQQPAEAIHHDR